MTNFERYYSDQAGNGLQGFSGVRYQKGYGFFGRIVSKMVLPVLRFLGSNALKAGANIANDIVDTDDFSFDNIKQISRKRLSEKAKGMMKEGAQKILSGNGIRRRKKVIKEVKKLKKDKRRKTQKRQNKKSVEKPKKKRNLKKIAKKKSIKAKDFLKL